MFKHIYRPELHPLTDTFLVCHLHIKTFLCLYVNVHDDETNRKEEEQFYSSVVKQIETVVSYVRLSDAAHEKEMLRLSTSSQNMHQDYGRMYGL